MNNNVIQTIPVDYQPNLANDLFHYIQHQPWAMLLRSASEDHVDSRFDILVACPVVTLTTKIDSTLVTTPDGHYTSSDDPFELLATLQEHYLPGIKHGGELPFIGGAVGYFSYDLGRRVETLPNIAIDDIELPEMVVGLYEWALVIDHHNKSAFVVGHQPEHHWQWLQAQKQYQVPQNKNEQKNNELTPFKLSSAWQSNMTKADYSQKFDAVQQYLLSGDCYQINLAQRFHAQFQGSEWQAYQKLESYNLAPFSAFIRTDDGAILSVSPERFLQVKDRVIETKPIKGTRPRSQDANQDRNYANELTNAEKDQAENLMIVDLLRNDIGRVAKPGSVHVPKLFDIESFPAVHHLVSTIRAKLDDDFSNADLLKACFPGGSITGAPKVRAMEIIEELEPHRRSAYCGSIGYISRNGAMDTSITIRTLVAKEGTIYAWAGGGVVADSQCESEYQETLDKLSRILPVLARHSTSQ
ncbi:aminodeoxychorismate synthase component I [Vibrio genomosp. F10]|uniref:aminodeoxychorismate synthase component I n=1 Tax=Vibrio genomosp. F10 TaxID=723171 RepID=UPI0002F8E9F8|nr:aminodeoxychorismate synthase component I [Vibrio genomosp. F10]OEF03905.1 aminodeoxychorismate synthase, component I [Vibrio genomosp. F10 str. 9ZB36]